MKFRPYREGDYENLAPRLGEEYAHMDVQRLLEVSLAWSVEHDDAMVCVMGMVIPWEGLGEIWALVSDDARSHGKAFTRGTRVLIEGYMAERKLRRVDCHVHIDKLEYRRWIELLGFEPDYVKEMAAPDGGDLVGYVKWGTDRCLEEAAPPQRQSPTTGDSGSSSAPGQQTQPRRVNGA